MGRSGGRRPPTPLPSCYFWRATSTTFRMRAAKANRTKSKAHKLPNVMALPPSLSAGGITGAADMSAGDSAGNQHSRQPL